MFTRRSASSTTRYRSIRLSPIVEYSRLQPPVGVSAVLSPIGEGHPLRSPMRHSLGEPLPHQLADTWQAAPEAPELYPDTNFDIVSLAPHPSQSLYEISMRTRRKFQLLDRLRRYAKVGVRVYSCETISKLMFGTIWDYPVFRRAIPNFGVRSYLLLPRLPVALRPP